jgi:hypothetical protein
MTKLTVTGAPMKNGVSGCGTTLSERFITFRSLKGGRVFWPLSHGRCGTRTVSGSDSYSRRGVMPATADRLATIRSTATVQCVYCNKKLVLGQTSIALHEQYCPDRATVERQYQRAKARFQRKRAGFA